MQKGRPLTQSEQKHLEFLHLEKVEKYLDAGHGACFLRRDDIAGIVANALWHFNDQAYKLFAWCIMPNTSILLCNHLRKSYRRLCTHGSGSRPQKQIHASIVKEYSGSVNILITFYVTKKVLNVPSNTYGQIQKRQA